MPFNKVQFNPGINREVTKYTNEAGWYDCNRIRFREGYPEQIGGWQALGKNTFTGVCRSLHQWVTLNFVRYTGLGTNVKFMVETGTNYYDITPLRTTVSLTGKMYTVSGQPFIRIVDAAGGFTLGSYVTVTDASAIGGITLTGEQVIADVDSSFTDATCDTTSGDATVTHDANARIYPGLPVSGTGIPAGAYVSSLNSSTSFELSAAATATNTNTTLTFDGTKVFKVTTANADATTNNGGGTFSLAYQINVGPDFQIPTRGWNSLPWNGGVYNGDSDGSEAIRIWNQANYGEDLIIGPRGGELYYWDSSAGTGTRAIPLKNVTNGAAIPASFQQTGCGYLSGSKGVTHPENANIVVGATVSGANIPAGATVAGIESPTVFRLSAATTGLGSNQTLSFNTDPISVTEDSNSLVVTDASLSRVYKAGQHVTISGATAIGNLTTDVINTRHKIFSVDEAAGTFTTESIGTVATSTTTGGGNSVNLQYELSAEVPVVQDNLLVSDASRFVFAFGCNAFGDATETQNPLLLRWSDQENAYDWRPRSTNQAGDLQLSQGTEIVAAIQSRQEILVFTDAALYSLQYVGAPVVWGSQLVGSNLSVASSKAVAYANGVAYWMGKGKFYKYDGVVQPLDCTVQEYVFSKLDIGQYEQVFAGSLEEFHEIWWFYVSTNNTTKIAPDKYVVYNYLDGVWYFGELDRSAWFDSPINDYPLAATSQYTLVEHENGNNDGQNYASVRPINSYITSGQFGIESGDSFTFIDKIIPDLSFIGSTSRGTVTMSLLPSSAPGLDNNNPLSEGGTNAGEVDQTYDLDEHTPLLYVRIRGRQLALKLSCNSAGTKWKLGTPRLNMRPDGRRGKN